MNEYFYKANSLLYVDVEYVLHENMWKNSYLSSVTVFYIYSNLVLVYVVRRCVFPAQNRLTINALISGEFMQTFCIESMEKGSNITFLLSVYCACALVFISLHLSEFR